MAILALALLGSPLAAEAQQAGNVPRIGYLSPGFFQTQRRQIAELAAKGRLPAVGRMREDAEAGCLMAYGANYRDLVRRAATFVDKILKGANPGDLAIEQPTNFELVINLKTAKVLGLTIPPAVLARADQVIH